MIWRLAVRVREGGQRILAIDPDTKTGVSVKRTNVVDDREYLGLQPASPVSTLMAQIFTVLYFAFFLLMPIYTKLDKTKPIPERVKYHG